MYQNNYNIFFIEDVVFKKAASDSFECGTKVDSFVAVRNLFVINTFIIYIIS